MNIESSAPEVQVAANLPVVWSERPFGARPCVVEMREGASIDEMVCQAVANHGLAARFLDDGFVRVNDIDVPREWWGRVRPRRGRASLPVVVTFHLPLRAGGGGGSGGSKNPIATIALLAVLVTATVLSGGLAAGLVPALGTTLIGTYTVGQALGAAVLIGGSLLIAALTPPPKLAVSAEQPAAIDNEGKAASLNGNVLAPGAAVPRVIGTHRIFPPFGCEPLNELVGDLEYIEAVMVLSGPHALSALRAGDVSADDISELDYQLIEGVPGDAVQAVVTRQGRTHAANLELSRHKVDKTSQYILIDQDTPSNSIPQWNAFVTRDAPDEIWLRLVWTEGLFRDSDPTSAMSQPLRIRFRRRGDSTWINCPEVHFSANRPGLFQKDVRFIWGSIPSTPNTPETNQAPILAYKTVPGQSTLTPTTSGWTANSYFSAGAGNEFLNAATIATSNVENTELFEDKVIFWLSAATFSQDVQYEVQVLVGEAYLTSGFTAATYVYAADHDIAAVHDFFYYFTDTTGTSRIATDQATVHYRVVCKFIASVWNENPIQSDDMAQVAVRVRGRALEQFSVLASGYVNDWDGSAWENFTTTSNPAPHYRDVLAGSLNADPMPADLIDDDSLVAWRQHCLGRDYHADMVVDGRPGFDVLTAIAGAGYARPRQSEQWDVLIDRDRRYDYPTQIFSFRNLAGLRFEKPFAKRPTGLRVRFDDIDDDYIETEEIVLDPLDPAADESRLEDIRYDAIVDRDKAIARAQFDLKQAALRLTFFHATADGEASLVCRRGDLVGVQHDVIYRYAGSARVLAVNTTDGGATVIGLTLDGTVPIVASEDAWTDTASAWSGYSAAWAAPRNGVAIRLRDGSLMTREVTATDGLTETKNLSFAIPFSVPAGSILARDCLVTVGPLASEYQRMLVFEVVPRADFQCDITFVPEAQDLWPSPEDPPFVGGARVPEEVLIDWAPPPPPMLPRRLGARPVPAP